MVDQFIASFKTTPEKLVLDFDATDKLLYGQQEGRFFHGYYIRDWSVARKATTRATW